jgi:calcineurin-like phosphoesterase family protein
VSYLKRLNGHKFLVMGNHDTESLKTCDEIEVLDPFHDIRRPKGGHVPLSDRIVAVQKPSELAFARTLSRYVPQSI